MITWKRTGIFLLIAIVLVVCYFAFLAPPPYYMQEGGFLERSGSNFGTGVPYNQFNTTGRFVKQNPYSYWYIYKEGEQPGIYKESAGGIKSVRLTDNSARCMNLYLDETTGEEWIYYVDDDNNLWRVNDSGTINEHIRDHCPYIFIIGSSLLYMTEDNKIYEAGVFDFDGIQNDQGLLRAEASNPVFGYRDDYWLYYEAYNAAGASAVFCKHIEYTPEPGAEIICPSVPDKWFPFVSSSLLYVDHGNLYALSGKTNKLLYEGIPADSRIYYTGQYIFFEGDKENNTDTYPLYRIDAADGKNLKKELALDNIYCELYFFEGHLYQYDTVKGNLHRIYRLSARLNVK